MLQVNTNFDGLTRWSFVGLAFSLIVSISRVSLGTPSALFSLGAESQALGKTGVAGVEDHGAVVLNPAALAASPERALWLGYGAARFAPELSGYSGDVPAQPAYASVALGLRMPIVPSWVPPGLTLGMALTSPRDVIVRADLPLPETPQFPLLSSQAQALDLGLALGARLSSAWFVGLGLRALAGLEGEVEVASESTAGGVEDELALGLAPVVGVLFRPSGGDSLGLVFRGALSAPFEVELRDQGLPGIRLPPLQIDGMAHYDPAELGLEWARGFGSTRMALGASYKLWSAFDGWLGRTVDCPEPGCAALPKEEVELADTLSPRLGVSHVLALSSVDLTLRAGYAFEPTPLPEQVGAANRWDNARSIVTLGWKVEFEAPLALAFVYQAHWLHERRHQKRDGAAAQENADVRVSGNVQFVGLDLELRY